MEVRKQFTKAAAVTMTVGTLAVAGFGIAGTAYAQGNQTQDNQHTMHRGPDQRQGQGQAQDQGQDHWQNNNWQGGNGHDNGDSHDNGDHHDNNGNNNDGHFDRSRFFIPRQQVQSITEFVQPQYVMQPSYWPFAAYASYTDSLSLQSQMSLISDTSAVLGVPAQTIVIDLSQGWTLSQIAAQYGWTHDYFLSALVGRIQSDVSTGVSNGSIDPAFAGVLVNNLISQATSSVDQAGLPVVLANIPFATLMQIFA